MMKLVKVLNDCLEAGIPFVSFREANQEIQSFTGQILEIDLNQPSPKSIPSGFLLAPFDLEHSPAYLLTDALIIIPGKTSLEDLQPFSIITKTIFTKSQFRSTQFEDYAEEYETFQQLLLNQQLNKVVASRRLLIDPLEIKEYASLYVSLTQEYPSAFVYWVNLPGVGSWMGASPETLLKLEGNMCKTMSLAGTKHPDQEISVFTSKEIQEQALVSRSIEQTLSKYATQVAIDGPKEILAGKLKHLQTKYEFELSTEDFLTLAVDLHPTPAVGGVPKKLAQASILNTESQGRKFYTGFLGPYRPSSGGSFYVNLRCLEIYSDNICLYTGGGLTTSSTLIDEWKEMEYKSETMLSVIEKIRKFAAKVKS
jgi:isochorismate synthase